MAGGQSCCQDLAMQEPVYRGRIAPSPTGYLHLGHARTFWVAHQRARRAGGRVVMRIDDLDGPRCREEFVQAAYEDLRWLGLDWDEGPDVGGDAGPYTQSERAANHREALLKLVRKGEVYPCHCSRKDIQLAANAPHEGEDELIYPGLCRSANPLPIEVDDWAEFENRFNQPKNGRKPCWRYRTTPGQRVAFDDVRLGSREYTVGESFGDFVIWRRDDLASYQIACAIDDSEMEITEVVRGEDLLVSTARQILVRRSLGLRVGDWCHCELLRDDRGVRLAKRHESLSLRELRSGGADPESWIQAWETEFRLIVA
jgi:glutamyl/glutaminyl-tRNA synthetase